MCLWLPPGGWKLHNPVMSLLRPLRWVISRTEYTQTLHYGGTGGQTVTICAVMYACASKLEPPGPRRSWQGPPFEEKGNWSTVLNWGMWATKFRAKFPVSFAGTAAMYSYCTGLLRVHCTGPGKKIVHEPKWSLPLQQGQGQEKKDEPHHDESTCDDGCTIVSRQDHTHNPTYTIWPRQLRSRQRVSQINPHIHAMYTQSSPGSADPTSGAPAQL